MWLLQGLLNLTSAKAGQIPDAYLICNTLVKVLAIKKKV